MGLRAKLPTTFLVLLATAIIAVSAIYLDRMLRLMVHGLVTSADRCGKEVFEQVRVALGQPGVTDPVATLRNDRALTGRNQFLAGVQRIRRLPAHRLDRRPRPGRFGYGYRCRRRRQQDGAAD